MSWVIFGYDPANYEEPNVFYVGPPTLVKPDEKQFLWEETASTATWFATKAQAARVARSIQRWLTWARHSEPTSRVTSISQWLKCLRVPDDEQEYLSIPASINKQKEIDAIEKRIATGEVTPIPADRAKLHRKSKTPKGRGQRMNQSQ